MAIDPQRHATLQTALRRFGLDAVICCGPTDVLLLTGYWPIIGPSVAVFNATGDVSVIVPEDERTLAEKTSGARIISYRPFTLEQLSTPLRALAGPLASILISLSLSGKNVGVEFRQRMQPATYAASFDYYGALIDLLENMHFAVRLESCETVLDSLKAVKTTKELEIIRKASRIAAAGFAKAPEWVRPGVRESEVAAACQQAFEVSTDLEGIQRSYGFFYCMSGENSAKASAAYARTRQRVLKEGDLVIIHANTCADGYWTDVSRTYTVGRPSERQNRIRCAIDEARGEALRAIQPGVSARDVDHAARSVMERYGFGAAFRHSTGHGVGFAAANANSIPRIHPKSPDVLETGMTFNTEPAAYFDGYGGMRHCDMVAVTDQGSEVLTKF
jgi:Xaa-Pro aminopeptidase